ncbi:MAG: succinylglutamate desuccinylase/aspartoacylase family protein [Anaerolineae bacterium]|uniref:succinylglutamate desuccinylase/aspartoacylase family protein n=1 Tax=Candidatus Flexifilum breve TaxID=3140694 RepID=UPI001ACE1334|nr:succinylglutamate desuccinylase/aspartoacylase family protein [Chloroflexota bacterium]MBK9747644.1 succinylglutamate desuccinylase/aspartoacylase family protein [Chloroflexota bacterium]MBN8638026.1 succinylglutamate desuccinylase/aspartoacylase family protein [Anaerolineae bacterium]
MTLKVGQLEAQPGEHVFGYLKTAASRSGLSPDFPIHLFAGAEPGPTMLVQGAIHGGEIIGSIAILNFIGKLDPKTLRGNVIAVPVVNRVGFELGERGSRLDGKDMSRLFPGKKNGSVTDQAAYVYFEEVIRQANVMVDFHAGARTAYERYVLFSAEADPNNLTELEKMRRKLVVAFGLDQAAFFPPGTFGNNSAKEAIDGAGVAQITLEFGGGTGWFKNGADNVRDAERGIWNILKSMRIIDGAFEADGDLCTVYNAGVVIWKPDVDGLFVRLKAFRDELKAGDVYGQLLDPYTGDVLADMKTPKDGIVIPSGQEWPTVGATSIGILGTIDRVEDRRTADLYVY